MVRNTIDKHWRVVKRGFLAAAPLLKYPEIPLSWYEITWPPNLDSKQVNSLLYGLSGNRASRGMNFVVVAKNRSISYFIGLPLHYENALSEYFNSFLPETELSLAFPNHSTPVLAARLHMSTKLRTLESKHPEIIAQSVLSALQAVGANESLTIEMVLGVCKSSENVSAKVSSFRNESIRKMLVEAFINGTRELDASALRSLREKRSVAGWNAGLQIGVSAETTQRASELLDHVSDALKSAEAPGVKLYTKRYNPNRHKSEYLPTLWPLVVNVNELTGLVCWPLGDKIIPGLARSTSRRLAVPDNIPASGRIIGTSVIKDSKKKLSISVEDSTMHMHIMGPTGVGKSTLILNLAAQDIKDGRGVIVVDPKGDLVNEILLRVPKKRSDDVIVLDPSDLDRPVGLNPLYRHDSLPNLVADDILSIFRNLYGSYFGPRSEDILHAGLLTLACVPDMSLCALPNLYTNAAFRYRLVQQLDDPLGLNSFWAWFDTVSDNQRNNALAPVMNKLRAFLLRPAIRRVLGQSRPKLNLEDVLSGQKILLVNLAKGSLGSETSQLFGSLLVSQVWQAIQRRANVLPEERSPAFLYVDEVQDYLHLPTDIGDVLTQARSYGVGMILSHQHLGQLPRDLKSAVISNARSRVCFQLGRDDATAMARGSKILTPEDFENLNRYHIYARLVRKGKVSSWMSGKTLPPTRILSDPEILKALSRDKYGVDAIDVEDELGQLLIGSGRLQPVSTGRVLNNTKLVKL